MPELHRRFRFEEHESGRIRRHVDGPLQHRRYTRVLRQANREHSARPIRGRVTLAAFRVFHVWIRLFPLLVRSRRITFRDNGYRVSSMELDCLRSAAYSIDMLRHERRAHYNGNSQRVGYEEFYAEQRVP